MEGNKDKNINNYQIMNEYMHSLIRSLQKEVQSNFLSNPKLYIYYKYNSKMLTLYVFIKVHKRNPWYKDGDINYLITIGKDYPKKAPYVCCLTDFHDKINIFDMRNIQKNLVGEWNQKCTISHLIAEMLTFSDTLAFQAENDLLPAVGEYIYSSYTYDINDFLINNENLLFRIFYLADEKNVDIYKKEKYMILTRTTALFFSRKNQNKKQLCRIEFKFELTWIDSLRTFSNSKYPEFIFFEFIWNNHSNYLHKFVFAIKKDMKTDNKIYDNIIDRKRDLLNKFKFFEKHNDNNAEIIEKIINIKQNYLNNYRFSRSLYEQINKLYKKIINIFSSFNDEGYQQYVQKLQMFLGKYEKNNYIK